MRRKQTQTGPGERTSVRAFTTRDKGSVKSPYLTINLASIPPSGNLCTTSGWVSADATRRTKSFGPFFWTLHETRCRLYHSMGKWRRTRVPSVENIYLDLLRGSLDCGDFIVRDGFPEVVIADLSLVAFANEQTRFGLQGIDVVFQLYRDSDICGPKTMRLRTSCQRGTAFAALGEFSTTAVNFACGNRGTNFVNPKVL
jgi:hypothetical protein